MWSGEAGRSGLIGLTGAIAPPAVVSPVGMPSPAVRLADGRVLRFAEYGPSSGAPVVMVPDAGSSRLAAGWLLGDALSRLGVRLLMVDRVAVGARDVAAPRGPVGLPAAVGRLVRILALGRVVVVGLGCGADDAIGLAVRYPGLVAAVLAVAPGPPLGRRGAVGRGIVQRWRRAAGRHADLTSEATWARAVRRMSDADRRVVEPRWRSSAFRRAVAADAAQWVRRGRLAPTVGMSPDMCSVPVRAWVGSDDEPVSAPYGWRTIRVDGPSAMFDAWGEVLGAADSIRRSG